MALRLKVLTLNCWGIPIICPKRKERITAIAEALSEGEYDIVLLQEIWAQSDYDKITAKLLSAYPFTHYWHSGMIGSGVCIFSKHPILETFQFRFGLNGYAHKPLHGDWFAGKCVGLAKVLVKDGNDFIKLNVYGTHTHACYNHNPGADEYEAHRVAQGFEMSQYIKHTSESCDVVIAAGDFNNQPSELGYKLIKFNANLKDALETQIIPQNQKYIDGTFVDDENEGNTSTRPDNSFVTKQDLKFFPKGHRIDYIMYRENSGFSVSCEKCYVTMQKVPGKPFNYSDHEGVAAILTIKRNVTGMNFSYENEDICNQLKETLPYFEKGIKKVKSDRIYFCMAVPFCILVYVLLSALDLPILLNEFIIVLKIVVLLFTGFSVWNIVVLANKEINGLTAAKKDVKTILRFSEKY